jgi:TonB family protein
MDAQKSWVVSVIVAVTFNIALFGVMGYLIGHTDEARAVEAVPIKLLSYAPSEPPKPLPKRTIKKQEKKKIREKKPTKKLLGVSKEPDPEPEVEEEIEPDEPDYQPLYSLSAMPSFVRQVEPKYPPKERFKGREARVVAEVSIDVNGSVRSVRIIESGGGVFYGAVKVAISKSIFTPGYQNGKPVATRVKIPYQFKLR